jgi:hypothetical protein
VSLLIVALLAVEAHAFESPSYAVLFEDGPFEVRRYESFLVAQVNVSSDAESAGNVAFPALAGYISGDNASNSKISMTTPVQQIVAGDTQVVAFMMPTKWQLDTLPAPDDGNVQLTRVPSRIIASYRYRGNWSEERFWQFERRLRNALSFTDYQVCSGPMWARYNPPFWPTMLRRNEVQFVVSQQDCWQSPSS